MCYAKPGPRCSPHMYSNLMAARRAVKRRPHSKERREELDKAREEFLTSPRGIEALRTGRVEVGSQVDADGNTVPAYLPSSNFGIKQDAEEADRRQVEREQLLAGLREELAEEDRPARRGRPPLPAEEKFSKQLEPNFTPEEKEALKQAADAEGITVAELVRTRLDADEDTSDYENLGGEIITTIDGNQEGRRDKWGNRTEAKKALQERKLFAAPMSTRTTGRKPTAGEDVKRSQNVVRPGGHVFSKPTARVKVNVHEETSEQITRKAGALGISKSDYIRRKVLFGNPAVLEAHQGSAAMRKQAVGMVNVARYGWDWKSKSEKEEFEPAA